MKTLFSRTSLDLVLLTMVGGSADALGYLQLGKVFTANMSGNVVLLGIAVSGGQSGDTGRTLFSLLAFITGGLAGAWICRRDSKAGTWTHAMNVAIGCEAALLLAYAVFSTLVSPSQTAYAYPLIALLGIAMGLQGAAVYRLAVPGIVTTVVTGTLTSLTTKLVKTLSSPSTPENQIHAASFGLRLWVILAYGGGAALSGLLVFHAPVVAGFVPGTIVAAVVLTRLK